MSKRRNRIAKHSSNGRYVGSANESCITRKQMIREMRGNACYHDAHAQEAAKQVIAVKKANKKGKRRKQPFVRREKDLFTDMFWTRQQSVYLGAFEDLFSIFKCNLAVWLVIDRQSIHIYLGDNEPSESEFDSKMPLLRRFHTSREAIRKLLGGQPTFNWTRREKALIEDMRSRFNQAKTEFKASFAAEGPKQL